MKKLIIIFFYLLIYQRIGMCQILIGGERKNTIYSSVVNRVEYIGDTDCENLFVKIEGYDENIEFENCFFEIKNLKIDTSRLQILNRLDEIVFDTTLIRDKNSATGFLKVGKRLLTEGAIQKEDLEFLDKICVKYNCPWLKEPIVYGFSLIIVNKEGRYLAYEIRGSEIPNIYKEEILRMNNPIKLYIEQISWRPISCFEKMNSIELEIIN